MLSGSAVDVDRPVHAGVRQDRRVDDDLHRVVAGRQQRRPNHIQPGPHLGRVAAEIEVNLITLDGDRNLEFELLCAKRLTIEVVGETIGPIRNLGDAGAGLPFGVVEQGIASLLDRISAVAFAQPLHPAHPEPVGGELGAQIAESLVRHLTVEQDEFENILAKLAAVKDLDRRNPQPLLIDVGVAAVDEIGVVGEVADEADDLTVEEDR